MPFLCLVAVVGLTSLGEEDDAAGAEVEEDAEADEENALRCTDCRLEEAIADDMASKSD